MSAPPTFYTAHIGNAPMFVAYFARLAGIELDAQSLSIPKGEHKLPDYLAVAPTGQLPGLRDGDVTVWESTAIVRYLAAKHESAAYPLHDAERLAPIDSAFSWLWFNAWTSERDIAVQTFLIGVIQGGTPDLDKVADATARFKKNLEFMDATFFQTSPEFVVGNEPTVADALAGTLLWHTEVAARAEIDLSAYPRVHHYWTQLQATAAYRETFEVAYAAVAGLRAAKGLPA